MTTKTLAGTYTAGYTLSAGYSGLIVGATANVTGTPGHSSTTGKGGVGGDGILAIASVSVVSSGVVTGGQGGASGASSYQGVNGGGGGAGLDLAGGGSVTVTGGKIVGGLGGTGGAGRKMQGFDGGTGGQGGAGIALFGAGSVTVDGGTVVGGAGGAGGYGYNQSIGGQGGYGLSVKGSGAFTLTAGAVTGGMAGAAGPTSPKGGSFPSRGGSGVYLTGGGTLTNHGTVSGGPANAASYSYEGFGATLHDGTLINGSTTDRSALISGFDGVNSDYLNASFHQTIVNYGTIEGLGTSAGGGVGVTVASQETVINFGTITGAVGHDSVVCQEPGDRLIAAAGSKFVGAVEGGSFALPAKGSTLELAGGVGSISGLGTVATLSGAVSATVSGFGAYVIDAGGSWTFTGSNLLASTQSLTIGGATVWDAPTGAHLVLSGAVTVTSTGSIDAIGATPLGINAVAIVNGGLIEATGQGRVLFNGTTIANGPGGVISAGTGSKVVLEGAHVIGGALTTTGSGIIEFAAAASVLDGTASALTNRARAVVFNGTTVTVEGTIAGNGLVILGGSTRQTALVIAAVGATLSGGGAIDFGNSAQNVVMGATGAATLVNVSDKLEGGGRLGAGQLTLVNQAGGIIEGTGAVGLTIDTGANTIVNAGLIWAADHAVTVDSAIANSGRLYALRSVLTLAGAVSGTGTANINAGTLNAESAFGQNVVFLGGTGVLELSLSQTYAGEIVGFSTSGKTSLDLRDIGFVSSSEATFSGTTARGVLTVSDGTHTAHITLIGNFVASNFLTSSDGHGGVIVVDPPGARMATAPQSTFTSSRPHQFIATMAGLGGSADGAIHTSAGWSERAPMLVKPHVIIA